MTSYQGSVRAVIAATITRPASVPARPGIRFGLIDQALDPVVTATGRSAAARLGRLKQDLAAVVSAEAFFSLTDLGGLSVDDAIASLVRSAQAITEAGLRGIGAQRRPDLPGEPVSGAGCGVRQAASGAAAMCAATAAAPWGAMRMV